MTLLKRQIFKQQNCNGRVKINFYVILINNNLRLVQVESICREQNKCDSNIET